MSRVRNAAIAVSENMACYENLANAIILQAVKAGCQSKEPGCNARERKIGTILSLSVV